MTNTALRVARVLLDASPPEAADAAVYCKRAGEALVGTVLAALGRHPPKMRHIRYELNYLLFDEPIAVPLAVLDGPLFRGVTYGHTYPESGVPEPEPDEVAACLTEITAAREAVFAWLLERGFPR